MKSTKSTVLITGGSKGIGLAIAKEFAKHSHNLVLVARDLKTLQQASAEIKQTYSVDIHTIVLDLANHQAPENLLQQLEKAGISIDILVNNAGMGMTGVFADSDYQTLQNMLQLNMHSLKIGRAHV